MDMGLEAELDTLLPSSSDSKLSDGEATFNSTRSMALLLWLEPKRRRNVSVEGNEQNKRQTLLHSILKH